MRRKSKRESWRMVTVVVVHQAQEPWRNAGAPIKLSGSSPRKLGDASIAQRRSRSPRTLQSALFDVLQMCLFPFPLFLPCGGGLSLAETATPFAGTPGCQ